MPEQRIKPNTRRSADRNDDNGQGACGCGPNPRQWIRETGSVRKNSKHLT